MSKTTPRKLKEEKLKKVTVLAADENVLQILHSDHCKVADLFFQFSQAEQSNEKEDLVRTIISELAAHAKVEEEIVYPAIRRADKENEDLIDEADTEHHVVKFLMSELMNMRADDDFYDSKVTVLSELVNHHVQEEEKEIFEKLEKSGADLQELGAQVLARKEELVSGRKHSVKNSLSENSKADQKTPKKNHRDVRTKRLNPSAETGKSPAHHGGAFV